MLCVCVLVCVLEKTNGMLSFRGLIKEQEVMQASLLCVFVCVHVYACACVCGGYVCVGRESKLEVAGFFIVNACFLT